jgi:hypothetical protein
VELKGMDLEIMDMGNMKLWDIGVCIYYSIILYYLVFMIYTKNMNNKLY